MTCRLILLEGAPATGKSTVCSFLHARMPQSNLYSEFGAENPIFGFWDFMKYLVEPCRIVLEDPEKSMLDAMPALDAAELEARVLRTLHVFAGSSIPTTIVDGSFVGAPMMLLRLGYDLKAQHVASFVAKMFDAVRPLAPSLVWLTKSSIDQVMAEIDTGRPGHGDWVTRLMAGSPHARRRGIEPTRAGLRVVLNELLQLGEEIFESLDVSKATFRSGIDVWRREREFGDEIYAWTAGALAV